MPKSKGKETKRNGTKKRDRTSDKKLLFYENAIAHANGISRHVAKIIDIIKNGGSMRELLWSLIRLSESAFLLKRLLIMEKDKEKAKAGQDE